MRTEGTLCICTCVLGGSACSAMLGVLFFPSVFPWFPMGFLSCPTLAANRPKCDGSCLFPVAGQRAAHRWRISRHKKIEASSRILAGAFLSSWGSQLLEPKLLRNAGPAAAQRPADPRFYSHFRIQKLTTHHGFGPEV